MNKKNFISLYKMNRLWGDGRLEAAYWALRGKAFLTSFEGRLLEDQIPNPATDPEDKWWQQVIK
jgi:hypothetical protein